MLHWYADNARDLPWRAADRTPWGVLVSEVMLQQTQVSRVEPKWLAWMGRWPAPQALAEESLPEVIRAWQGLGYPRRARRLHRAAQQITDRHGGDVPSDLHALRELPGVGDYTAAAVVAFAFRGSIAVLDTNVRRVLSRWLAGAAFPGTASVGRRERSLAEALLPGAGLAPLWSVAVMELGALVCTARSPACEVCPLQLECAWAADGFPPGAPRARQNPFEGSDRQARGFLLRAVAEGSGCSEAELIGLWADRRTGGAAAEQAAAALASLSADGLIDRCDGLVALPRE